MKKKIFITTALLVVMTVTLAYAGNIVTKEVYNSTFNIRLNGAVYTPTSPILSYEGRTYLQLREFANITGNKVDFINDEIIISTNNAKEEYEIDTAYSNAMDESVDTTAEIISITNTYSYKWEKEMEKNYDKLYGMINDEEKQLLADSQKSWEEFVDANLKIEYALDPCTGGSGSEMSYSSLTYRYNKERAIQLKSLCYDAEIRYEI